jgi:hypothetical protein
MMMTIDSRAHGASREVYYVTNRFDLAAIDGDERPGAEENEIVGRIVHVTNHHDSVSFEGEERLDTEENDIVDWIVRLTNLPDLVSIDGDDSLPRSNPHDR